MFKRLFAVVLLASLLALGTVPAAKAQTASVSQWVANPTSPASGEKIMAGFPDDPASMDVTSQTTTATTTAQAITALSGRKRVRIDIDTTGTAGVVWLKVGSTTPAIQSGIPLYSDPASGPTTFERDYNTNVPLGYVASTAVRVTVTQEGQFKNK